MKPGSHGCIEEAFALLRLRATRLRFFLGSTWFRLRPEHGLGFRVWGERKMPLGLGWFRVSGLG